MFPGKPCHFVAIGKGCTEYDERPEQPCKKFLCGWRVIDEMPDSFKPSESHVIFAFYQTPKNKIQYLKIVKAPTNPSIEVLTWAVIYAVNNKINLAWDVNDKTYYIGDIKFCEDAKTLFG